MDERAKLVEQLFTVLEETKDGATDARGEKNDFLEWLETKMGKLIELEKVTNEE